ncbi:MAG: phage GP46 family protein [Planctomycetota bacterium]
MVDLYFDEEADLRIQDGDLALDLGLASAVLVSVFTDGRVDADASPDGTVRGWWGEDEADPWGSTLWALVREKQTAATATRIREAVEASLVWLREEGIAESVTVGVSFAQPDRVLLEVTVARGSSRRWAHLWDAIRDAEVVRDPVTLAMTFDGGT